MEAFLALADKFGLSIAIIAVIAFAIYKRILITGSEKDRADEAWTRELQYREDRRIEERRARLAAESALRKVTDSMTRLTDQTDRVADLIEQAFQKKVLP